MSAIRVVHLGCAGHFILADRCSFRRNTEIHTSTGGYRISTVGNLYHEGKTADIMGKGRQTLGAGLDSFFETYVFALTAKQVDGNEECGCREVSSWAEIDGERTATAGAAQAAHERWIAYYLERAQAEEKP